MPNPLLNLAIGDAFGAGYEFCTPNLTTLGSYTQHPRHRSIRPGQYTDDTQMSIAVAEAILSKQPLTPLLFANAFVSCFKRDPREGYASGFYNLLLSVPDGKDLLEKITPTSNKCGAAMRSVPLGYLDFRTILQVAPMQAAVTHNKEGQDSSLLVALSTYYLRCSGTHLGLKEFLLSILPAYRDLFTWTGFVDGKAIPTVSAALTGIATHTSMTELLRWCINLGGDVDSVAAIALGLGSFSSQIDQDIPQYLISQLENNTYGKDYINSLDIKLNAF